MGWSLLKKLKTISVPMIDCLGLLLWDELHEYDENKHFTLGKMVQPQIDSCLKFLDLISNLVNSLVLNDEQIDTFRTLISHRFQARRPICYRSGCLLIVEELCWLLQNCCHILTTNPIKTHYTQRQINFRMIHFYQLAVQVNNILSKIILN